MDLEVLEKIGLTKNQSKIYVSLLKLGEATAQQIMNESGLHRSRVYDGLEKLISQGFVSSIVRDFKQYFQAISPEKLMEFIEEKKEALKKLIPELKSLEGMKKEEINASIYQGKEGLKTIHYEMIKEEKDIFVLGAKGLIFKDMPYFIDNFEKQRFKKKIKMYCLWDNENSSKLTQKNNLIEGKILPDGYSSNTAVNIFGTKVAIVL